MKKNLLQLIILFLFIGGIGFSQTLLLQESFEVDATNYDANTFTDDVSDYFLVHSNGAALPTGWTSTLSNIDGTYYFAGEDLDATENLVATEGYIVLSSQTISAYSEVQVTVALAIGTLASFESTETDGIKIQYAFDGNIATAGDANVNTGTYSTIGEFAGNLPSGAPLSEDTNMDGTGDETALSNAFQDFTYTFSTNGATNVSIRIVADCDGSEEIAVDNIRIYGITAASAPTVTTDAASSISITTATLNSTVNANGASTTVTFEYGLTDSYGTTITADESPATGTSSTSASYDLTGLSANTTYHYRVVGTNSGGTTYGADQTLTTNPKAATITTQAVSNISTETATGNGNITDLGTPNPSAHGVCWSTSETPTIIDNVVSIGAASSTGTFSASITSLSPNTLYYVRAYATNTAGTSYGTQVSFTTLKITPNVTSWPNAASITYGQDLSAATLSGGSASTTGSFAYDDNTVIPSAGSYSAAITFSPSDMTNYDTVAGNINVEVAKATPVITWENPDDIVKGTALSETQLNATADVDGTFEYSPALGTILESGNSQTLSVTFTPSDAENYNTANANVVINVSIITGLNNRSVSKQVIYPNPFVNSIHLKNISDDITYIAISDLSGKMILKSTYKGQEDLDLSHLNSGIYLLSLVGENKVNQMIKIVKE